MTGERPKAILFDMDDTILAYNSVADGVWQVVCNRFAPRVEGLQPDELLKSVQEYRDWYWSDPDRHRRGRLNLSDARLDIVAGAFERLGIDDPSLVKQIGDRFSTLRDEAVRPANGALETLRRLQNGGLRLALVTNGNGEHQRRKIDRFGLAALFDYIIIEGEFGAGKPDERVYMHALDQLHSRPAEAWIVGDNLEWDVAAPQRLGIFGIWVDPAGKGLPASSAVRPDRIIGSLPELL